MKFNPLVVIAIIFGCSFVGRMIGVADASLNTPNKALAENPSHPPEMAKLAMATEAVAMPGDKGDKGRVDERTMKIARALDDPLETERLLKAVRDRYETLDKKETDLDDRLRYLEIIEARVDEKLVELKNSNTSLSELVSFADEAAQKDIDLLSAMYEQMKPKKAGEIFDKMDPAFAAGFLTQMNSENAALILTNMNTDKAYETSMIIASRNAAVHRQ